MDDEKAIASLLKQLIESFKTGKDSLDKAEQLIHQGIDINRLIADAEGNQRTLLYFAAAYNHLPVCKLLIEHPDIDLNIQDSKRGFTALHLAARHANVELCQVLLSPDNFQKGKIDLNIRDKNKDTPLETAVRIILRRAYRNKHTLSRKVNSTVQHFFHMGSLYSDQKRRLECIALFAESDSSIHRNNVRMHFIKEKYFSEKVFFQIDDAITLGLQKRVMNTPKVEEEKIKISKPLLEAAVLEFFQFESRSKTLTEAEKLLEKDPSLKEKMDQIVSEEIQKKGKTLKRVLNGTEFNINNRFLHQQINLARYTNSNGGEEKYSAFTSAVILSNSCFSDYLTGAKLIFMAQRPETFPIIFNEPAFLEKMAHLAIAFKKNEPKFVFKEQEQVQKLRSEYSNSMKPYHEQFTQNRLIKTKLKTRYAEAICANGNELFIDLGKRLEVAARYFINNPQFFTQLGVPGLSVDDRVELMCIHPHVAHHVLANQFLLKPILQDPQVTNHLFRLISVLDHVQFKSYIMDDDCMVIEDHQITGEIKYHVKRINSIEQLHYLTIVICILRQTTLVSIMQTLEDAHIKLTQIANFYLKDDLKGTFSKKPFDENCRVLAVALEKRYKLKNEGLEGLQAKINLAVAKIKARERIQVPFEYAMAGL
jgi:hypothetical protein